MRRGLKWSHFTVNVPPRSVTAPWLRGLSSGSRDALQYRAAIKQATRYGEMEYEQAVEVTSDGTAEIVLPCYASSVDFGYGTFSVPPTTDSEAPRMRFDFGRYLRSVENRSAAGLTIDLDELRFRVIGLASDASDVRLTRTAGQLNLPELVSAGGSTLPGAPKYIRGSKAPIVVVRGIQVNLLGIGKVQDATLLAVVESSVERDRCGPYTQSPLDFRFLTPAQLGIKTIWLDRTREVDRVVVREAASGEVVAERVFKAKRAECPKSTAESAVLSLPPDRSFEAAWLEGFR